jgi:hypothetical protein
LSERDFSGKVELSLDGRVGQVQGRARRVFTHKKTKNETYLFVFLDEFLLLFGWKKGLSGIALAVRRTSVKRVSAL